MLPDSPAPQADPLAEFKQAFEKYQKCQAYCVEGQEQFDRGGIAFVQGKSLERRRIERRIAAEGLWVSGMAGLFSLLTTNYQAQERLVAEQVKAAHVTARWTIVMAIVAAVTIAYTALVGRPIFSKPSPPVEVNLVAPATIRQSPSLPTVIHDAAQLD
jgi:hypothetical protein